MFENNKNQNFNFCLIYISRAYLKNHPDTKPNDLN